MALSKQTNPLDIDFSQFTSFVAFDRCDFQTTATRFRRNLVGQNQFTLFRECSFLPEQVSFRCRSCDGHIAWTCDLVNREGQTPVMSKYKEFPGCDDQVLVQWFRNDQGNHLEVTVVEGANVQAGEPQGTDYSVYKCWFMRDWKFANCINCGKQLGWIFIKGNDIFYGLMMQNVVYD